MTLNLTAVGRLLNNVTAEMSQHRRAAEDTALTALALLRSHADNPDALTGRLSLAAQVAVDSDLRFLCAAPNGERLDAAIPLPPGPERLTVLASDGSQILPDRHGAMLYYLINAGGIVYKHGSNETPKTYNPLPAIRYHPQDLLTDSGDIIAPAEVRLYRDLAEIQTLLDLAELPRIVGDPAPESDEPVIALTDGPLRLRTADLSPDLREDGQADYQEMLDILRDAGVLSAGYVDRPRSYYVLSMLHLASLPRITEAALAQSPYRFVTDLDLFRRILPPGHRSALFGMVDAESAAGLALSDAEGPGTFFFYINVGDKESRPILARVEIPPWLAGDAAAVETLHYAIVRQSAIAGGYPYVLARAHELAIISKAERDAVETMLHGKLRKAGFEPRASLKQAQKDLLKGE